MAVSMKQSGAAVQYARALLDLANEQKQGEAIGEEMRKIGEIIAENKTLRAFITDPGISAGDRTGLLDRVFRGKVSPLVMNIMGVLNSKGRLRLLPQVVEAYDELLDEQLGKIEVDVTVVQKLDPATLEEVRKRI